MDTTLFNADPVWDFLHDHWLFLFVLVLFLLTRLLRFNHVSKQIKEANDEVYDNVRKDVANTKSKAERDDQDERWYRSMDKWELTEYINDLRERQGLAAIENDLPDLPRHHLGTGDTLSMKFPNYRSDVCEFVREIQAQDKDGPEENSMRAEDI